MRKIAITIGPLLISGSAGAHPEHLLGGDFGPGHFLTDPFHVVLTAVAVSLLFVGWRSLVRKNSIVRSAR
jgi:hypothetical protein